MAVDITSVRHLKSFLRHSYRIVIFFGRNLLQKSTTARYYPRAMNDTSRKQATPPYATPAAFDAFLAHFSGRDTEGAVNLAEMPGISESTQTQLFSTLKYLGLITADRHFTDTMHTLAVASEDKRKRILDEIFRTAYSFVFVVSPGLTLTAAELDQLLIKQGASGSTVRKCTAFFIHFANLAGYDVSRAEERRSNREQKETPVSMSTPIKPNIETMQIPQPALALAPPTNSGKPEEIKTVRLSNAGTLTLGLNISLMQLRGKDREFVFKLIDQLQEYEDAAHAAETSSAQV